VREFDRPRGKARLLSSPECEHEITLRPPPYSHTAQARHERGEPGRYSKDLNRVDNTADKAVPVTHHDLRSGKRGAMGRYMAAKAGVLHPFWVD
jgi:hypothetical protein